MARKKKFRDVEVTISSLNDEGCGAGVFTHSEGQSHVAVPFTTAGDVLTARLLRKRKGVMQAKALDFTTLSESRIQARCAHFADCGGCLLQHLPYSEQLRWKQERMRRLFADGELRPILACEDPWHYRNKMEYSFSENREGDRFLGLMQAQARGRVLNLQECHLAEAWHMPCLEAVRAWWEQSELHAYHAPSDRGSLRSLTLRDARSSGDRMIILLVSGNPEFALNKAQLSAFVSRVQEVSTAQEPGARLSVFLRIQQIQKGKETQFFEMQLAGPDHLRERLHVMGRSLDFMISPAAFFQPNTRQAEQIYTQALTLAGDSLKGIVYDLYCGTGTLGILASPHADKVIGVELSPESSLDARTNAAENGADNYTVITGDVGRVLSEQKEAADLVLLDPPRAGLDDRALEHVLVLNAAKIIYISCNPKTQAANAEVLVAGGYRLTVVQPVDQFPHTPHLENICVFEREP